MSIHKLASQVSSKFLKLLTGAFLIRFCYLFTGFLTSILLTRILSIKDYGAYSVILSLVGFLCVVIQFGWPTMIMRDTALAFSDKNWRLIKSLIWYSHQWVFRCFILCMCITTIMYICYPEPPLMFSIETLFLAVLITFFLSLIAIREAFLKGFQYVLLAQLGDSFFRPVIFILICGVIFYMAISVSLEHILMIYLICVFVAFIAIHMIYQRCRPREIKTQIKAREDVAYGSLFHFGGVGVLNIINTQSTILLASIFVDVEDVALLRIAMLFSGIVVIFLQVVDMVFLPKLSTLIQNGDRASLKSLFKKLVLCLSSIAFVTVIIFTLFGKQALGLFYGEYYQAAYLPLLILVSGQAFVIALGPLALLMVLLKREHMVQKITVFTLIINLLLQAFMGFEFGVIGIAIAVTCALMIRYILFLKCLYADILS